MLSAFFSQWNVTEFVAVPYSACRVLNPALEARLFGTQKPKCCVLFLLPYYVRGITPTVSRYAVSRDYHLFVREVEESARALPHFLCAAADHSPIDERDLAVRSGLCVRGENGLAIHKTWGSFCFLATLFFSEEICAVTEPGQGEDCLSCGRCKQACPTYLCSRGECLSAVSQKKRITKEEAALLKKHGILWGCDLCQEVCPMNRNVPETPIPFFCSALVPSPDGQTLFEMVESGEFQKRAYAWRGERVILRNLAISEEKEG